MCIFIVEDDCEVVSYICKGMCEFGYVVDYVVDGEEGLEMVWVAEYDVFVVDWMMLCMDGLIMVEILCQDDDYMFVLIFFVLGEVDDCVEGFKVGGDDYFVKFYVFVELLVCVEVLVCCCDLEMVCIKLVVGDLEMDLFVCMVNWGEEEILLQLCEFCLLEFFMKYFGQVVIWIMLLEKVWDYYFDFQMNVIDVYIFCLCFKIDKFFLCLFLYMVCGVGYCLQV